MYTIRGCVVQKTFVGFWGGVIIIEISNNDEVRDECPVTPTIQFLNVYNPETDSQSNIDFHRPFYNWVICFNIKNQ